MNRIVLWSVLAAMILVLGGQSEAAPVEWSVAAGGNGHFYEPVLSTGTWDTAKAAAEAMGVLTQGYLATITSAEENAFVYGLVSNPVYWLVTTDARGPWLGGYQTTEAGGPAANWRWVTGETWSYTNWDSGQPNNYGGGDPGEDSLHFFNGNASIPADTWNDTLHSDSAPGYIVEYNSNPVPEAPTGILFLVGLALLGLGRGLRRIPRFWTRVKV